MPFSALLGEWARVNDEWNRFRTLVDSPSRVLEAIRPRPPYEVFQGGKSVQAAAKAWGVPLLIAMERAYMGVREGDLYPLRRYAWYALRIRYQGRKGKTLEEFGAIQALLDGTRNLGEVIASGVPVSLVRRYLVHALASGELAPPGRGWLLRDLTWEMEKKREPRGIPQGSGTGWGLLLFARAVLSVGAPPDLAPTGATVAFAHLPPLKRLPRKGTSAPCASAGTSSWKRHSCARWSLWPPYQ